MIRPAETPAAARRRRVLHDLRLLAEAQADLQAPGLVALDDHVALARLEKALHTISYWAERTAEAARELRRLGDAAACGRCAGTTRGPDGKACGYCYGSGRAR